MFERKKPQIVVAHHKEGIDRTKKVSLAAKKSTSISLNFEPIATFIIKTVVIYNLRKELVDYLTVFLDGLCERDCVSIRT